MPSTIMPFPARELGLAARVLRTGGRVLAMAAGVAKGLRHRRDVAGLLQLDARSLKDIGLQPSDVRVALASPLSEDPSIWLRQRSLDRQAAWRTMSDARVRDASAPAPKLTRCGTVAARLRAPSGI